MPYFYVNTNAQYDTGDHEVHEKDMCPTPPKPENRHDLGWHTSCHGAVAAAKATHPTADGCAHCCPDCHTS